MGKISSDHTKTTTVKTLTYMEQRRMSAYTKIICPCTKRQAGYKKYSPDALTPPSRSYFPFALIRDWYKRSLVRATFLSFSSLASARLEKRWGSSAQWSYNTWAQ
jgi:hypothetical protein